MSTSVSRNWLLDFLPAEAIQAQHPTIWDQFPWYPMANLAGHINQPDNPLYLQRVLAFNQQPLRLQFLMNPPARHDPPASTAMHTKIATSEPQFVESELLQENNPIRPTEDPLVSVQDAPIEGEKEPNSTSTGEIEIGPTQLEAPIEAPKLQELLKHISPLPADPSVDSETLSFQPFHTVDYFASLGIRIDGNLPTNTRFDKQLRSFTDWLKTMKRVNYQEMGTQMTDEVVVRQARHSLKDEAVLTFPMAEVLIKQGKYVQAIELLQKLTLLHPEKTAFFAAQIEILKAKL